PQRTSSILCVLWRPRCSVGAAGTGDGRRSRARRAGGGCRAVRGAGAPLPRPLCAICGSDAGLARRGRGCGPGCLRAGFRSAGAVPGTSQVFRVAVSDPAQPLLRRAAASDPGRASPRGDGRSDRRARSTGRERGAGRAGARTRTSARRPDAGATRGVRAEARRGARVRGDRGDDWRHRRLAQDAHASGVCPIARAVEGALMTETFHPLVKRLLDGELSLGDLPPGLRGEGAEALRLLGAVDRTPVALSVQLEARVMAEVRRRARSPMRRIWRGLVEPRDIALALPQGHHQYAFVVDGEQWVADPAAPGVDDGFGRRNSMVAVTARGARIL